ncbi:MAG TPA: PQQ-binding-like beta-propeller repeat protein [Thermoanaerobaculia bacterium]|nr:PQQ-binding-like beta-propeller repeat protein [Thermoanaerobaculia bacterium]
MTAARHHRTLRLVVLATVLPIAAAGSLAASDSAEALRAAARQGDLATIQRLHREGTPLDAADRWGKTALAFAAAEGHAEAVRWLLEQGADPNLRESFFGGAALDSALMEGHTEIAASLLGAGADQRAQVFDLAARRDELDLARAAAEGGPVSVSEKQELVERHGGRGGEWKTLLDRLATVPDPPPPSYSREQLATFTGDFEGWENDALAVVELSADRLSLRLDDADPVALEPAGEQLFQGAGGVSVAFFGRAGTVEGLRVARSGTAPVTLRRSVADPVADAARRVRAEAAASDPARRTVNWPGFRGDNGDGIGDGEAAPVSWNLETGEGVAWKADLPGLANSSPVIWNERVFVTSAVAEGGSVALETGLTGAGTEVEEATEHRWLVLAFDKRTGEKLWETEVGRGVPLTRRHFKATQANSTPATDGQHLVVIFPTAGLACLGLDGEIHWKHELGGLNAGGFNDPTLQWGYASSPTIFEDRVIVQVDVHDGPYLAAWELETGELLWKTERPEVAPSWSTPAVWETPAGTQIVTNASLIHGYDPSDGRELWSLGPSSVQVVSMPVIGDGVVYVGAGYPPAKPIYAVKPTIRGDVEVEPGEPHAALAWSQERGGAYMPTPLLYRGLLYVVHHNGRLVAYEASSGDAVYKARFSRAGTFTNSPIAVDGRIYTGTEEGLLYVVEAGPEYRELAVHDFGEPLMATPAVSEGVLYVRTPSKLWALGSTAPAAKN